MGSRRPLEVTLNRREDPLCVEGGGKGEGLGSSVATIFVFYRR